MSRPVLVVVTYLTDRAVPVVRVAHIKYMRITTWGGEPQRTSSFDGEEYLDRCGVAPYMRDALALLLENRPAGARLASMVSAATPSSSPPPLPPLFRAEPIGFLVQYFHAALSESTALTRALRLIRLAPRSQTAFKDNLVAAFAALGGQQAAVINHDPLKTLIQVVDESEITCAVSRAGAAFRWGATLRGGAGAGAQTANEQLPAPPRQGAADPTRQVCP